MSIRHVRAVQSYSKIEDDLTRHILEVVALDIGRDESPAHTSNRKIAERVRASVNTVRDRIQDAISSGELIAQKDGKYWFYTINSELLPYARTSESAETVGKSTGNRLITSKDFDTFREELYQSIETLYQGLYQKNEELYQSLYQNIVSIVSEVQSNGDREVRKVYGKEEREERARAKSKPPIVTPTLPGANPDDFDDELSDMETCLGQVCRETLTYPPHHEKIRSGAKALLADGHTVTDVRKFFAPGETYWYVQSYGKNGQKPYVANVLNEIATAREAGKVQQESNNAEQAWANVLSQVSSVGHGRFRDWKITSAERAAFVTVARQNGGIADVCTVPSGVLNSHIKTAFIQAYNNEAAS